MIGPWAQIRPHERRDAWLAFVSLFAFMCAYALLETARDALLLSRIPATRLPFVYIAVAAYGTAAQALLSKLLRDEETNAIENLFRLLALIHRDANFERVHRGLRHARGDVRSSPRPALEGSRGRPRCDGRTASRRPQPRSVLRRQSA